MGKRLTTDEFIEKAKKVHGDKYDYSKVEYVDSVTKIYITCPEHGGFFVLNTVAFGKIQIHIYMEEVAVCVPKQKQTLKIVVG